MRKSVAFAQGEDEMRDRLNGGKWVVGMLLIGFDFVWKWAGARDGLQEFGEVGQDWEGWYWRSSVPRWGVVQV